VSRTSHEEDSHADARRAPYR